MGFSQRIGSYFASWKGGRIDVEDAADGEEILCDERDTPGEGATRETSGQIESRNIDEGEEEMDDERIRILKMVEEHKITAEDAAKLLSALEMPTKTGEVSASPKARWLRIRVTDTVTGRNKVNVNVPMGVISAAGKLGASFGLQKYMEKEGIDVDEIIEAIRTGAEGKLVDVTDEDGTEHVEVFME